MEEMNICWKAEAKLSRRAETCRISAGTCMSTPLRLAPLQEPEGRLRTEAGRGPWYLMTPVQEATNIQHCHCTSVRSTLRRRCPGCA